VASTLGTSEAAHIAEDVQVIDKQEKPSFENREATENVDKVDEVNSWAAKNVVTSIVSNELRSDKEYNTVRELMRMGDSGCL
jgi:hypothetical protein